jgi:Protein of unknown function (DUF2950)
MTKMETQRLSEFAVPALAMAMLCAGAMIFIAAPARAQESGSAKTSSVVDTQPDGKAFHSAENAATALYAAASNNDEAQILVILGPKAKEILHWDNDPKVREEHRAAFAQKYKQMHRLAMEPDNTVALYVGAENWPLPIPIVQYKGMWYFDSELGVKEVLFRRIGRNETEALEVCHALVDAEKDFYTSNHAYTVKFVSDSNSRDGLYWPNSGSKSPIGPYLAHAGVSASEKANGEAYHGYYYRILSLQGPGAPGGAKKYDDGGQMTGGFAILAYPAEYRESGVMTFIMDQNGEAYEKDLGATTADMTKEITSYNPDSTWKKAE